MGPEGDHGGCFTSVVIVIGVDDELDVGQTIFVASGKTDLRLCDGDLDRGCDCKSGCLRSQRG